MGRSIPVCPSKNLRDARSLIYALLWLEITPTFNIVHRRGADRTQNYLTLIKHRKLDDGIANSPPSSNFIAPR
jgi:hypothetical protein